MELRAPHIIATLLVSLLLALLVTRLGKEMDVPQPSILPVFLDGAYPAGTPPFSGVFGGMESLPKGVEPVDAAGIFYRKEDRTTVRMGVKAHHITLEYVPCIQNLPAEVERTCAIAAVAITAEKDGQPTHWNSYLKTPGGMLFNGRLISGADPATFTVLDARAAYARDARHVFLEGRIFGADPKTFEVLGAFPDTLRHEFVSVDVELAPDWSSYDRDDLPAPPITHARDAKYVYYNGLHLADNAPEGYVVVDKAEGLYSVNTILGLLYYRGKVIARWDFDPASVTALGSGLAVTDKAVYWYGEPFTLPAEEWASLRPVPGTRDYAVTDAAVYYREPMWLEGRIHHKPPRRIAGAKPGAFRVYGAAEVVSAFGPFQPFNTDRHYATDGRTVFYKGKEVAGAAPASFTPRVTRVRFFGGSGRGADNTLAEFHYAVDAAHVFVEGAVLPGAHPDSLEFIDLRYAKDAGTVFFYDAYHPESSVWMYVSPAQREVLNQGSTYAYIPIPGADPETFEPLYGTHFEYAKDANGVFWEAKPIPGADPGSVEVLYHLVSRDKRAVYYKDNELPGLSPGALRVYDDGDGNLLLTDGGKIYYGDKHLAEADAPSFTGVPITADTSLLGFSSGDAKIERALRKLREAPDNPRGEGAVYGYFPYCKDARHVWYRGAIVEGADPESFVYHISRRHKEFARDKNRYYVDGKAAGPVR